MKKLSLLFLCSIPVWASCSSRPVKIPLIMVPEWTRIPSFPINCPLTSPLLFRRICQRLKSAPVVDTLKGREIYGHLEVFHTHGRPRRTHLVKHIIYAIRRYNIDQVKTVTYESEDDGRIKNLVVVEAPEFEGRTWEYGLTITDAESEGEDDGGIGMQIFWRQESQGGITLIKPYNLDRTNESDMAQAMFRIDYSGAGELGYDHHMIVSIADMPSIDPLLAPFAMDGMKMFVGQKGDNVDVYGNSSHPKCQIPHRKSRLQLGLCGFRFQRG